MHEVTELRSVLSLSAVTVVSGIAFAVWAASPVQPPPETTQPPAVAVPQLDPLPFPVADIHPGLRGVARTVFEGNRLEEFEVEFLGVLRNAIGPQQDMILARLHGEKVEFTGVVAGMSGSPVYIDGRIVGAISYRLGAFAKEPIAGITPIADMMRAGTPSVRPRIAQFQTSGNLLDWLERGPEKASAQAPGVPGRTDAVPAGRSATSCRSPRRSSAPAAMPRCSITMPRRSRPSGCTPPREGAVARRRTRLRIHPRCAPARRWAPSWPAAT